MKFKQYLILQRNTVLIITLLLSFVFTGVVTAVGPDPAGNQAASANAMLKLQGTVKYNMLETGFYEVEGFRLAGQIDFSKYAGKEVMIFGKVDDSPSIYMTKAIAVKGFRVLNEAGNGPRFDKIGIFMNGAEVLSDVPPVIKNDRVLVPVRVITEKLGAKVEWDGAAKTVTISNKYMAVKLVIGSNKALIYHNYDFTGIPEEVILDQAAEINNDRTTVPLRFIMERFNAKVDWVQEGRLVLIESEDGKEPKDKELNLNASIDSGIYTGRIDSNFIEIRISGVPESIGFRAFQLSEELKASFDSLGLKENDTVKFHYITNENGTKVIVSIEKI